jgi:hypothetical protein
VLNATVDPAGLFARRDRAEAAARLLQQGRPIPLDNVDDRRLQATYAKLGSVPDIVIFGSSRVMELGGEIAPGLRVYNAATGSNTLYDTIALAGLFVTDARKPRIVIIGADPWLLDHGQRNGRWRTLHEPYRETATRLGIPAEPDTGELDETWPTLLSLGYTLESIDWLRANWRELFEAARDPGARPAAGDGLGLKRPDGSIVYPAAFRQRGADAIRAAALAHARKHVTDLQKGGQLDPAAIDRFERLTRYLRAAGVQVIFLLPPYHPLHYAYVVAHDTAGTLARTDATYRDIAQRADVRVAGAYDPAKAGCSENEFWDGLHARKGCLDRLVEPVLGPLLATAAETDVR